LPGTAAGGEEGIELYRTHRDEIALVLLDVQMPELDGPATLVRVRAIDPSVKCWFMSGNIGAYRVEDLRGLGCGILVKPFSPADFGSMIASEGLLEAQTAQVGNGHSSGPIQSSKRE
jgi:CheY-like chemotaxis protein